MRNYKIFIFLLTSIFCGACSKYDVDWAVGTADFRDLPAVIASKNKTLDVDIEVKLIENSDMASMFAGNVVAAYLDAREALTAMAKNKIDVDVIAVTYREKSGKPERLLVVVTQWRTVNPEKAKYVLEAHRKAIRALKNDPDNNLAAACEWLKKPAQACADIYKSGRWESGLYVDELIDMLDDIRAAGEIDAKQADALALRLLQTKSIPSEQ